MNTKVDHEFQAELNAVHEIHSVSSILDVIHQSTGMGFVVVARVTVGRWVACEVLDAIDFGLRPGDELMIETTICHEIRQSHVPVAIDHVAMSDVIAPPHAVDVWVPELHLRSDRPEGRHFLRNAMRHRSQTCAGQ